MASGSILNSLRTENEVAQKSETYSMSVDSDIPEDVDMETTANNVVEAVESAKVEVRQKEVMVVDDDDEDDGEVHVVRAQL